SPARWAGPSALCAVLANLQHQLPVGPADEQEQDFIAPGNLLHFLQVAHPDPVDRDDDVAASQPALPGRASGLDIRDFHAAAAGCRLRRKLCAFEAWMDILAAALCHRPLAKDSRDRPGIAIPKQLDPDGVAGALQADRVSQFPAVVDLLVVDPDDDVVHLYPGFFGGGARLDIGDQCAAIDFGTERLGAFRVDRGDGDAEQAAANFTEVDDLAHDRARDLRRHGETDADVAAGAGEDRGIDTDEFAPHVHERATRVAGINGRIGLDEVLDNVAAAERGADAGAADSADDSRGHGVTESERIADSDHEITDLDGARIANRDFREIARFHFQHCYIGRRVRPHDLGIQRIFVEQVNLDLVRAIDYVMIGENVAVLRVDDDTGAGTRHFARPTGNLREAKEAAKHLVTVG